MRRKTEDVPLAYGRLTELLSYDPDNGDFVWIAKSSRKTVIGSIAGYILGTGYRYIVIDGSSYTCARLAWFYVHREWPAHQVTHINGDKTDDRIANLGLKPPREGKRELSRERLGELLHYDPETGKFTYKVAASNRIRVGDEAGVVQAHGYRYMSVDGVKYLAHRLAWFLVHNEWPTMIDHINGDKDDNRILNLRPATAAQNAWNSGKRSTNASGHKGVSWSKTKKKWHARIGANYRIYLLGYFDTKEEAIRAYQEAADRLHGVFANLGAGVASG